MKRNTEELLYKKLIRDYGFYMKQYKSNHNNLQKYIALKNVDGGVYAVLITDEINENIDIYEAKKFLSSILEKFSLNVVIFLKDDNKYISSNEEKNKIIISREGQIISCSENCMPLMNIFKGLADNNKQNGVMRDEIITISIIAVNVLMFLLCAYMSGSVFDINYMFLLAMGGKYGPLIDAGQYFRLFTCMFLHGGLIHLLCNMYSLYITGPQIEKIYGKINYILIYIITGLISSIVSYAVAPNTLSIGASGAVFGLIGALLAFAYSERKKINKKYISGLIQVIIINLVIGFTMSNIDNSAHIGGVISGFVIGLVFYNAKKSIRAGDRLE